MTIAEWLVYGSQVVALLALAVALGLSFVLRDLHREAFKDALEAAALRLAEKQRAPR